MENKNFSERIKIIRNHFGLKGVEFAKKLGVSPGFISELENGKKNPGQDLFLSLKRIFNINLNWLLAGEGEMILSKNSLQPNNGGICIGHGIGNGNVLIVSGQQYSLKNPDNEFVVKANDLIRALSTAPSDIRKNILGLLLSAYGMYIERAKQEIDK